MRWFRLHTRQTSCLALFALALQLVLSLGHTHGAKGQLSLADAQGPAFTSTKSGSIDRPAGPAGQHSDDICSICASITLAGSLVLPAPPTTTVPPAIERAWAPHALASTASKARRNSFQARAPPDQGDALENCRAAA
jgi:hypothetical protein